MKRVLVTGATGFIGRHCIEPLRERGFEVHAIEHKAEMSSEGITWHHRDLLAGDPATLVHTIAPTHLLHLAWYAVPGKYWTSRENLRWVRASLALHEAFVASGGKRAVMAGSCAEYDWSAGVCRELETLIAPRTYYGQCKRALGDLLLTDANHLGISAAWARIFFLFGPHEHPDRLIATMIRTLLAGGTAKCSQGSQQRDFLYVGDAAAALVALLDSDVQGPVNIASGTPITVRELVEKVARMIGKGAISFGALPEDPDAVVVADVKRLRDEVGFTPAADLDTRLRSTIAWWRDQSDRVV